MQRNAPEFSVVVEDVMRKFKIMNTWIHPMLVMNLLPVLWNYLNQRKKSSLSTKNSRYRRMRWNRWRVELKSREIFICLFCSKSHLRTETNVLYLEKPATPVISRITSETQKSELQGMKQKLKFWLFFHHWYHLLSTTTLLRCPSATALLLSILQQRFISLFPKKKMRLKSKFHLNTQVSSHMFIFAFGLWA